MQYYIDGGGKIHGLESDGSQDHLLAANMQPISVSEAVERNKPTQEMLDAQRVSEIDTRLRQIDVESVRPLRAINNGNAVQYDHDRLAELDSEAQALRDERKGLTG